jgi:hypothetical protein
MDELVRQIAREPIWSAFVIVVLLLLAAPVIAIPVGLMRMAGRLWLRWKHVPLAAKNQIRAGIGGALVTLAAGLAVAKLPPVVDHFIDPIRLWVITGLAGVGLLYFGGGVAGSYGAQFDYFSAGWWAVLATACAALLIFGIPV